MAERKPLTLPDGVSVRLTDSGDYIYLLDGSRDICMSLVDARKLADWIYAQSPGEPSECPRCKGSGTVQALSGGGPDAYTVDADCPKCGATGQARYTCGRNVCESPGEPSEKPARRWVNAGSLNNGKCPWMVVPSGACCCLHEAHVGEHQLDHQWAHLAPSPETKDDQHEE